MKQLFYLFLVLFLIGCEGIFDDTIHYSMPVTQSKEYPVYLDMSEICTIQVKANAPITAPFKILSNDRFYFVGDRLKGVHVYEKKASGVSYLCFIECRYITDFELVDQRLFSNNLLDMVVIDVSNPMQINVLHRQKNHFNRYASYKDYWKVPYEEGKGLVVGKERHELTGVITDRQPDLDFSKLDQQFDHLTTREVPGNWFNNLPGDDRPYPAIINVGTDEIYTYGSFDSWAICSYRPGTFSVREVDLWTTPRVNYAPPKYYLGAYPVRLFVEDSLIFNLGTLTNRLSGYCDVILYHEQFPLAYHLYFPSFNPVDVCYMPQLKAFFALSGTSVWGVFIDGDAISGFQKTTKDFQVATDAVEIVRVGDQLVTLGSELSVFSASENELRLVKRYPEISGWCCKKEGNLLIVANTQGLMVYDMSDVENMQLLNK